MYIIGDIGNTEIKIFLISLKKKIKKKIVLKTNQITFKNLNKSIKVLLNKNLKIKKIIFSSVVPNKFLIISKFFKINLKIKCIDIKNLNLKNYINILANRRQVGSDRLANAISVIDNKNNYIVIDFGTATTFDVIKKKNYYGGVIAPGVELSLINLSNKASLIPIIKKISKSKKIVGKNTIDAVKSGFYWGYTGLINKIIKSIIKETRSNYKIIMTGGLAHLFKNSIDYNSKVDKEITLKGLIKLI